MRFHFHRTLLIDLRHSLPGGVQPARAPGSLERGHAHRSTGQGKHETSWTGWTDTRRDTDDRHHRGPARHVGGTRLRREQLRVTGVQAAVLHEHHLLRHTEENGLRRHGQRELEHEAPASGLPKDNFGVRRTVTRDFGSGGPFALPSPHRTACASTSTAPARSTSGRTSPRRSKRPSTSRFLPANTPCASTTPTGPAPPTSASATPPAPPPPSTRSSPSRRPGLPPRTTPQAATPG